MGIAPSEFRAFVALELMICLLLRTAHSARMDCANYCRHVNSGNIPYQVQMYGACGCDYQPYYSNPMPKYNYAPSYRPSYPMLQVQDLSTTVRTIPFNQQPDGTGIYYLPAEMQWPQKYQNSYVNNDFLNPSQIQNRPRGKLVYVPEVSPEMNQYSNFDFNIHQTAHIDLRPRFTAEHSTNMMKGNNDNIATRAIPEQDDHHHNHQYMDIGFRNLLSKNHGKQNKAKETLSSLNMTANEHHLKNCLELTNLVKSRILHNEDERKGNKTLLHKYKHLSNEAVSEEISKSCQHSSDVLEKDIKTIKTFKRPKPKIVNKEDIMEKPTKPPLRSHTAIPDESDSSHILENTTNEPKSIIEDRPENGIVESSIESIKEFDKGNLRNEGNKIEENDVTLSPTDPNVTEDFNEIERMDSSTSTKSAGEEVTDGAKNMHTSCTVNDNTNLQRIFNKTESSNKIDTDDQNYTTTVKYGDIKLNDTIHVNMTQKSKDYEEKAKEIGRDDNVEIKDTASTNSPTKTTDEGNAKITEINDSHVGVTMATDEEGNTSITGINNNVKVNNTHVNTTMATDEEVNTRVMGIHNSVKVNDTHVNATIATNEEDDTREMGINNNVKINSTHKNANIETNEEGNKRVIGINDILKINDTHINAAMATDNVSNANVTEIDEVNVNQVKATTIASNSKENHAVNVNIDNAHTTTETALQNLKLERSEATNITTTPLMEIYEPDIYTSNETDSSDENNVVILKVNPNEMKTSEDVNDEKFKHPQNKSERIDKFDKRLGIQNKTEVVKEIDDSAKINEIRINKTAKATDEVVPTLMGFNDIIMSTTPIIESTDPNEITNSDENNEMLMKINLKNSKEVDDKNLELSQNKTEGVNEVNDSATINDHMNIKTKTTDENSTLMGIDNVIVTTIPVTDIPKLSTSNGTDINDENNDIIEKTKSSEDFNDEKFKNSQNHTAGTKELAISDLNKTTKAMNENEKNLEFDNANTTITPTIDINETHETESSNENNEVILKVKPKKPKTSIEMIDEKLRLPQDNSERTEEFDDSLQATPSTERSVNSFTLNKNESNSALDDATPKTAANLKTNGKSDSNINPTVSTMETEATQSLGDINSTVSRNETVDTKVIPINIISSEQHLITESGNNDSAKLLDDSFEDSDKDTLPSFSARMKVGKSSKKSKVGMELVTNKLTGEVGTNIPTIPSIEPTSTEPTKTTMAISNDWATKPGHDGLNSLVKIRTIHQNKKGNGKKKNKSPETYKDKLILVKMLPPDNIQDNNLNNDISGTKEPDLNNDESSQFAISTFETPYNMITNTETVGRDEDLNKIPSNLSFRRLPHRKNMKSEFNEEQKLLQNSFPNTTNSNHTIQSTKRHTTIVADSQENVNSGQYVATTNNPIKNANKDNRRRNNETHDKVTPDQKRIPDNERIVSNIVTKETNKGIVTSMKDELVSNEELQGGKTDGETGATLPSNYMNESVTDLGEYPDDILNQYNGNARRNMNNKEVVGEDKLRDILDDKPNTLNQNITSEYLPAELRHPDNESLSGLPQATPSPDSLYTQPILNGKMYFVQNGTNLIPLKFIQKPNGNIALGIDGNFICKNLLSSLNETSVLLSVLCNKKITNDHVPKNNYTLVTLPETST